MEVGEPTGCCYDFQLYLSVPTGSFLVYAEVSVSINRYGGIAVATCLSLSCGADESTGIVTIGEISITPAHASVVVGDSVLFTVRLPTGLNTAGSHLRSDRTDVVRVSDGGWAKAIAVGTALVIAIANADTLKQVAAQVEVLGHR